MSFSNRGNDGFSVTTERDGSRSFRGDHDQRWDNNNSQRGYRGGSNYRGNRGNRGNRRGGSGFRHFNATSSKFRYNRHEADGDGDVSMSGDSRGGRSRGRYNSYNSRSRSNNRRGGSSYRGGQAGGSGTVKRNNEQWHKVMVPFGANMSKEELYTLVIQNIEGKFEPIQYSADEKSKRVYFFIEGSAPAEALRSISRRLNKPDGHKLIFHIQPSGAPAGTLDSTSLEKLKLRMSDRYDPSTQLLNLSSMYADEVLSKDNIFVPLNRAATMTAVTKIIAEYIPELTGLDISNNKLLSLGHMGDLVKAAPALTSLNLGKNQIRSIDELEKLKGWSNITELMIDGNDLCNNYSNQNVYVSAVRKIFPKVMTLDGNVLPPPITFDLETDLKLPPSLGSYFVNDEIKKTLVTFIKEYYTIYDSDKRRDLIPAYHENAQLSICTSKNPLMERQVGFNFYLDDSRNLKRIGHLDSEKLVKKTKIGVLGIASLLESLPKTTHDILSFKVDLTLALPSMLCFVLQGLFKENESRGDKAIVRAFSRSFITVPCGEGMVITNDMLMISNATMEQTRNAFKDAQKPSSNVSSSSQSQVSSPVAANVAGTSATAATTYSPEQLKMVESFSAQSGMNSHFSLQCLQENGWDYQRAGTIFSQLQTEGKIPPEAFVK
ncbi:nuclear RNA export factor 1 [Aplysia californica]|uniref:Nuclear RNA export factor 1 n=1 Tax=Aplysia californica TaxID=6500 RepID=A0ABM0JJ36_APLCA|nr:nuclear RNA export factor 1 [Aplysia californica]